MCAFDRFIPGMPRYPLYGFLTQRSLEVLLTRRRLWEFVPGQQHSLHSLMCLLRQKSEKKKIAFRSRRRSRNRGQTPLIAL